MHDVVDRALQIHGSLGYSTDLPLEAMYRFARAARFYDGPDEVHRETVARQILRGYEAPPDGVPTEHVPTRREAARAAVRRHARGGDGQRLSAAAGCRSASCVVALLVQLAIGGGFVVLAVNGFPLVGGGGRPTARPRRAATGPFAPVPAATVDRFDATRAFALIRRQVAVGPRPAGSPTLRALAERLRRCCRDGRFETVPGHPGCATSSAAARPEARDRARRPLRHRGHPPGFVGANDGAAGHGGGARARPRPAGQAPAAGAPRDPLRALRRRGGAGRHDATSTRDALRGSKAYVQRHAGEVRAMVLLDYIANRGPAAAARGQLDRAAVAQPARGGRARRRRRRLPAATQATIFDDHTPFLRRGIPAIDLIDFTYRYADTPATRSTSSPSAASTPSARRSLELLRSWRELTAGAGSCVRVHSGAMAAPSREAPPRRPARLLRRRRPRRADRRARARAARRARLRAQGDRPQQARRRAAARARRDLRRRARRLDPRGRGHRLLRPRRLAGGPRRRRARGLQTIDATCPLVTKVHREAVKFAAEGYTIVLIGHAGHEEVEGTMGEAPERHRARRDRGRRRRARGRGPRARSPTSRRRRCRSTRRARSSTACASGSRTSPGRAPTTSATRRPTARRPSSRWPRTATSCW